MMKEFEHVVVITHTSMTYGTEVERVLPLNSDYESDVVNEMKELMKPVVDKYADNDSFEKYLSPIDEVDRLIDVYEWLQETYVWSEGYSFTVKLIG